MLIVSAGMEKSGTGWYFNMTNDILVSAGFSDSRLVREQYGLQSVMEHFNCNLGELTTSKLARLKPPLRDGRTFCVKTHGGHSPDLAQFMLDEEVKVTYIYRDPRDVVLSLMDHGRKSRLQGEAHIFATIHSVQSAVDWVVSKLIPIWEQWFAAEGVLLVRYEDLFDAAREEMIKLCEYLGLSLKNEQLLEIGLKYDPSNFKQFGSKGLHFNKGQKFRYALEMNNQDIELCNRHFSPYLEKMKYPEQ